jgi:ribosomal protein S18 acetylase RimI-like enzyme
MSDPATTITYLRGGTELLDVVQPLWEQLNRHHAEISPDFAEDFHTNKFSQRKAKLLEKYANGQLRVDLAQSEGRAIGYLISAITPDSVGEIESIFVAAEFRGQAIGDELMRRALGWFDEQQVHTRIIAVAVGNERAYSFYARFGFYPRVVMLKHKEQI